MKEKHIIGLCAGIFAVWLLSGVMLMLVFEPGERGVFGDMFGAVNSLFSGLALAGVIVAILLQRKELELQRKELELTRNELQASAIAARESSQALTKQAEISRTTAELQALKALVDADSQIINEAYEKWHNTSEQFKRAGIGKPNVGKSTERREQCIKRIQEILDIKT